MTSRLGRHRGQPTDGTDRTWCPGKHAAPGLIVVTDENGDVTDIFIDHYPEEGTP
jgi:hypothetical protein